MSQPYVGEIRMFAGNFAPTGWALCDGSLLSISQNAALFSLIGTTYGGDGVTTFALPDLRGRFPLHQGGGTTLGATGGAETVTLTLAEIPAHTHLPTASTSAGTSQDPGGNFWANWTGSQYGTQAPSVALAPEAAGVAGGSQPHENMPPFVTINFIISLFGVFPSQN